MQFYISGGQNTETQIDMDPILTGLILLYYIHHVYSSNLS